MVPTSFNNLRFWQPWVHISEGGQLARAEFQLLPFAVQGATVPTTPYRLSNLGREC